MAPLSFTARTLDGSELHLLFEDGSYADQLFEKKVVTDAAAARNSIWDYYHLLPSPDGSNIPGITQLRDILFSLAPDLHLLNSLTIVAPHIHWSGRRPVIYTYSAEKNRYTTGPQPIDEAGSYTPVSFVFAREGPLPYEWAHTSVPLDQALWKQYFQLIQALNDALPDPEIPLGIAISFRKPADMVYTPDMRREEDTGQVCWYVVQDMPVTA